jgi:hypothetical protein
MRTLSHLSRRFANLAELFRSIEFAQTIAQRLKVVLWGQRCRIEKRARSFSFSSFFFSYELRYVGRYVSRGSKYQEIIVVNSN